MVSAKRQALAAAGHVYIKDDTQPGIRGTVPAWIEYRRIAVGPSRKGFMAAHPSRSRKHRRSR